jgi:DNA replication protein DnaC
MEQATMDTKQTELLIESRLPLRYRERFKTAQGDGPWLQAGQDIYDRLGRGSLIALIGKSGVGKTQIGANLIYSVIKNHRWPCRYVTAMDFFLLIKASYHRDSPDTEEMVLSNFAKPILLIIDEYEKRAETQWEDRLLDHLINKRYGLMKETILISNSNQESLETMLGPANVSRMNESGMLVVCDWKSFREGGQCG